MKFLNCIGLLTIVSALLSCDDGDIVINDFEFIDTQLSFCNTDTKGVLFNINQTNEVISIELNTPFNAFSPTDINGRTTNINNASVIYRKLSSSIGNGSNYFCSAVPDTSIDVIQELVDDGSGQIVTRTFVVDDEDIDKDGLKNSEEGFIANTPDEELQDSDNDSIPDYLDLDDDNDNVATIDELDLIENPENPTTEETRQARDTDGDGILDHLDPDDDNDAILTRNEVTVKNTNPVNVPSLNEIPKYLDATDTSSDASSQTDVADRLIVINRIITNYRTTIVLTDLGLTDGETTVVRREFTMGEFTQSQTTTQEVLFETDEITKETTILGPIEIE